MHALIYGSTQAIKQAISKKTTNEDSVIMPHPRTNCSIKVTA